MTGLVERREARQRTAQCHAEDMAIATDIILRMVAPIDVLIRALDQAGGSAKLVKALRGELAVRRGGRR